MDISIDTIVNIVTLVLGGGCGSVITWRWIRRKSKAEAQSAEVNMAKEVQDTYQQMLADKQSEVEDKNRIISELRQDRDHFRQESIEQRDRQDKTDEKLRDLQRQVARNARMVENMRPFLCGVIKCKNRQQFAIEETSELETAQS